MSKKFKLKNWFTPPKLIAIATLIVTTCKIWERINFFSKEQVIEVTKGCDISKVEQYISNEGNSSQKLILSAFICK